MAAAADDASAVYASRRPAAPNKSKDGPSFAAYVATLLRHIQLWATPIVNTILGRMQLRATQIVNTTLGHMQPRRKRIEQQQSQSSSQDESEEPLGQ